MYTLIAFGSFVEIMLLVTSLALFIVAIGGFLTVVLSNDDTGYYSPVKQDVKKLFIISLLVLFWPFTVIVYGRRFPGLLRNMVNRWRAV